MRKIVVNDKKWEWCVGRSNVLIKHDREKHVVKHVDIVLHRFNNDRSAAFDYVERGYYKRYFSITPADIAHYLNNL